jgi:hypothetical protein
VPVAGLAALNTGKTAEIQLMSCGSPGNCTLVGFFDSRTGSGGFSVAQKNGVWSGVQGFTGLTDGTEIDALSCWPGGTCTAIGDYAIQHKKHTADAIFVAAAPPPTDDQTACMIRVTPPLCRST